MSQVIEAVEDYLQEHKWYYDESDPESLDYWGYRSGKSTAYKCGGIVEKDVLLISAVLPTLYLADEISPLINSVFAGTCTVEDVSKEFISRDWCAKDKQLALN